MKRWTHFWASARSQSGVGARAGAGWRRLWREEEGQTLVEYGLLIGLLALVIITAVAFFGRRMSNNLYGTSNNVLPFNN